MITRSTSIVVNCEEKNFKMSKAETSTKVNRTKRAGIVFPVGRIKNLLKDNEYNLEVGVGAAVYLAAVLEYLSAELTELSGNVARDDRKMRILPRHIEKAVREDEELTGMLRELTVSQGGIMPNIFSIFLPERSLKKNNEVEENVSKDLEDLLI